MRCYCLRTDTSSTTGTMSMKAATKDLDTTKISLENASPMENIPRDLSLRPQVIRLSRLYSYRPYTT